MLIITLLFSATQICTGQLHANKIQTSTNLIQNGSMTDWRLKSGSTSQYESLPFGFTGGTNSDTCFSKGSEMFEGKNSIRLNFKLSNSGSARYFTTPSTRLTPGSYQLTFWIKGEGYFRAVNLANSKSESVSTKVANENTLVGFPLGSTSGAKLFEVWTKLSVTYDVIIEEDYLLCFAVNNYNASGAKPFYLSDISLNKLNITFDYKQRAPMPKANAGAIPLPSGTAWQSNMISIDESGEITYNNDSDGYRLPDFSHAGYKNGDAPIPYVPVVKVISPIEGDNTYHLQQAFNSMEGFPLDNNGIRGAILLKKGLYPVKGPISLTHSGVVIRGEGYGNDPATSTIIYDYLRDDDGYVSQRSVLKIGLNSGSWSYEKNNETPILDDIVPIGSYTVRIAKNANYNVGDVVCIYHPCSPKWLEAVNYGEVGRPDFAAVYAWDSTTANIQYHRYVTQKKDIGNESLITLDAPVFYPLNKSLSQSTLYKFTNKVAQNIGIENIRITTNGDSINDEQHAWNCIYFQNLENCWAKNVVTTNFGKAGMIFQRSTRVTVDSCYSLDAAARSIGERMYNFSLSSMCQLILFQNCYARLSRHAFVSNGTSTVSGIVYYKCKSEAARTRSEGHRMWTQGMLFDSFEAFNPFTSKATELPVLGLFNRWEQGSGHGWGAVNSVLWNCNLRTDHSTPEARFYSPTNARAQITLEKPPTSQNYAIGCFLEKSTDIIIFYKKLGYIEGTNRAGLHPQSLYKAQYDYRKSLTTRITVPTVGNDGIKLYPNPAKGYFTVGFGASNVTECLVEIYTIEGKLAALSTLKTNELFDTTALGKGLYFAKIKLDDKIFSQKLMVE